MQMSKPVQRSCQNFENPQQKAINTVKNTINCDPVFDLRLVIINKNDFYLTE